MQLGHQAANCTTGTVNWRAMYGENAFVMRPAMFQSDIEAAEKAKQIDFDDLEKRARDYAKVGSGSYACRRPSRSQPGRWWAVRSRRVAGLPCLWQRQYCAACSSLAALLLCRLASRCGRKVARRRSWRRRKGSGQRHRSRQRHRRQRRPMVSTPAAVALPPRAALLRLPLPQLGIARSSCLSSRHLEASLLRHAPHLLVSTQPHQLPLRLSIRPQAARQTTRQSGDGRRRRGSRRGGRWLSTRRRSRTSGTGGPRRQRGRSRRQTRPSTELAAGEARPRFLPAAQPALRSAAPRLHCFAGGGHDLPPPCSALLPGFPSAPCLLFPSTPLLLPASSAPTLLL